MLLAMTVMMMLMGTGIRTSRLSASLRDRATLPSPLRGLDPSGGYPSRLRALRALRTPFARRLSALPAECRADTVTAIVDGAGSVTAVSSSRRRYAPRSSRNSLRSPWPLRRLRASPRLVAVALRASPVPASPCTAPGSRARTSADTSASASAAVLRTIPCSTLGASARSNPRRLRPAGFAGVDSPIAHTADLAVPYRRGGLGSHTRRIVDALSETLPAHPHKRIPVL